MTNIKFRRNILAELAEEFGFRSDPGMSGELVLWGEDGVVVAILADDSSEGLSRVQLYAWSPRDNFDLELVFDLDITVVPLHQVSVIMQDFIDRAKAQPHTAPAPLKFGADETS